MIYCRCNAKVIKEEPNTQKWIFTMTLMTNKNANAQDTICLFHYFILHDWQLQNESTRGNQQSIYYLIVYTWLLKSSKITCYDELILSWKINIDKHLVWKFRNIFLKWRLTWNCYLLNIYLYVKSIQFIFRNTPYCGESWIFRKKVRFATFEHRKNYMRVVL